MVQTKNHFPKTMSPQGCPVRMWYSLFQDRGICREKGSCHDTVCSRKEFYQSIKSIIHLEKKVQEFLQSKEFSSISFHHLEKKIVWPFWESKQFFWIKTIFPQSTFRLKKVKKTFLKHAVLLLDICRGPLVLSGASESRNLFFCQLRRALQWQTLATMKVRTS